MPDSGRLVIVSTPIGNLDDMSPRAAAALAEADLVACEDTRRTCMLLKHLDITARMISYHEHNEARRAAEITARLSEGATVAVVSDAGTPGLSDPAYRVVRAAVEAGCEVVAIPGPSALLAALVVSGLPTDRFIFEGFLPPKGAKRLRRLEALRDEPRTIVLYESPYRIIALVEAVADIFVDREISVSRELTKLHEETVRGPAPEVLARLREKPPRGEYTIVIHGAPREER